MDKSKVMVMQKQKSRARARKNCPLRIGKECAPCKYLGVMIKWNDKMIKWNGSFSIHIDTIREKADKAYFLLFLKAKSGVVSSLVFFFIYLTIWLLLF